MITRIIVHRSESEEPETIDISNATHAYQLKNMLGRIDPNFKDKVHASEIEKLKEEKATAIQERNEAREEVEKLKKDKKDKGKN